MCSKSAECIQEMFCKKFGFRISIQADKVAFFAILSGNLIIDMGPWGNGQMQ